LSGIANNTRHATAALKAAGVFVGKNKTQGLHYRAFIKNRGSLMQLTMLKSKIHMATLTGTELYYQGSIAIDQDLLDAAGMLPNEQVHVLNVNNGSRLVTYTISGERGSGIVELNGPAAHLGETGDQVVIISYAGMSRDEAAAYKPVVVHVDEKNAVRT
jgi:aspartate 1-decarboxylase